MNIPRNLNKNFKAWREGPNVLICTSNRIGPVYQFVYEDGRWHFDGLVGILNPGAKSSERPTSHSADRLRASPASPELTLATRQAESHRPLSRRKHLAGRVRCRRMWVISTPPPTPAQAHCFCNEQRTTDAGASAPLPRPSSAIRYSRPRPVDPTFPRSHTCGLPARYFDTVIISEKMARNARSRTESDVASLAIVMIPSAARVDCLTIRPTA